MQKIVKKVLNFFCFFIEIRWIYGEKQYSIFINWVFSGMIKKIWKKRRERVANGGSESSLFLQIYEKRGWKSDLTNTHYNKEELQSFQFAHILPKGMYPEYRLNPENIVFVDSIEQHQRVDRTVARNKAIFKDWIDRGVARQHLAEMREHPIIKPLREAGKLPLWSGF